MRRGLEGKSHNLYSEESAGFTVGVLGCAASSGASSC